jgi:hypothetical protein
MNVIRHDHELPEPDAGVVGGQSQPHLRRDRAEPAELDLSIMHFTQQTGPIVDADRDEVRAFLGIIELAETDRLTMVPARIVHATASYSPGWQIRQRSVRLL